MPCALNGRWRRFVIALITSCGSSFHRIGLALKKSSVCHTDKLYCCSEGFSGVGTVSHHYSLGASLSRRDSYYFVWLDTCHLTTVSPENLMVDSLKCCRALGEFE